MQDKTILVIDDDEQIRQLVNHDEQEERSHYASGGEGALRQFYRTSLIWSCRYDDAADERRARRRIRGLDVL